MATSPKKKKNAPKTEQDIKKDREIRHLEVLIKYSLKAIDGRSGPIDKLFTEQTKKIKKKLKEINDLR